MQKLIGSLQMTKQGSNLKDFIRQFQINTTLGDFMKSTIELTANVKTDQWMGYKSLSHDFENLIQVPSGKKGNNFPDLHRAIMLFKGWLRGMHHNVEYLQSYIDEYCYRFNRSNMKEEIFENLMKRIVTNLPFSYKQIIA